jgi:hypothetical protein
MLNLVLRDFTKVGLPLFLETILDAVRKSNLNSAAYFLSYEMIKNTYQSKHKKLKNSHYMIAGGVRSLFYILGRWHNVMGNYIPNRSVEDNFAR